MTETALGGAIEFLKDLGFFEVVLPFIFVFTVIFAILEKTNVLGDDKKNLNAMVAFVIGFFVIATNKVVNFINVLLPNVVVLVVLSISFLILIGIFAKDGEFDFKKDHGNLYWFFVFFMLIGVLLIFFNSITTDDGRSWLEFAWEYILQNFSGPVVMSVLLIIVVITVMLWVTGIIGGGSSSNDSEKKDEGDD